MLFTDEFWVAWLNPWLLCSFLFPICQIFYLNYRERKMWGEQIQPPMPLILKTCISGLMMGLVLSICLTFFTFTIQREEIWIVWVTALLLGLGGFRYLCFSYAIGLLATLQLLFSNFSLFWIDPYGFGKILQGFATNDWLWIAVSIHFVECLFVRMDGLGGRQLITTSHQSGKLVNGFMLNRIWPIPCLLFTPLGWLPVPLMIGFASYNLSKPIQQQKRLASTFTLLYTWILFGSLWLADYWNGGIWLAAFITLFGHEGLFRWQQWREKQAEPLYTSGELGLKVLEVLPASPAAQLGIQPGDILQKINDKSVYTIEDVKKITEQTAHCKLELLDQQLDYHFVQKVIYEDDPKHLGIIGAVSRMEIAATKEEDHLA